MYNFESIISEIAIKRPNIMAKNITIKAVFVISFLLGQTVIIKSLFMFEKKSNVLFSEFFMDFINTTLVFM